MPKVTVQIDPSVCILAANCVGIEPKLFQIGQESHVELTDAEGISQGTEYTFEATAPELDFRIVHAGPSHRRSSSRLVRPRWPIPTAVTG